MMDEASTNPATTEESGSIPDAPETLHHKRWHRRFVYALLVIVVLAAAIVLPPLVNIGRYQRQITALMATSLGRPVHLSSVELRLLPLPGFVLNDLSVSEDPAFGAEPALSAHTVVATIRILSLWKGKLEISRVTVDEASLNLVRSPQGRWNLESLMMGASEQGSSHLPVSTAQPNGKHHPFPYLEATNSRVNLKNGPEKTPFSVINTDLSLWQDNPGEWRVRLRGQPVRTDLDMSLADTGEVRLEASLRSAPQLRDMPLKLQMEWRDAQLGQLSRLLSGSDAGWRGAVTADITVQGTTEAAQTTARLQATGVGREEFTPATPIDFDANCHFLYDHSQNAVHKLGCGTAIGEGHLNLVAELPGNPAQDPSKSAASATTPPTAKLEIKQVPLQAALDLLRTVRRGFAPGIEAAGSLNGEFTYSPTASVQNPPSRAAQLAHRRPSQAAPTPPISLEGSLTVDGGRLQGGKLKAALTLPKWTMVPALLSDSRTGGQKVGITGLVTIPLSARSSKGFSSAESLNLHVGVIATGYSVSLGGAGNPAELRDLAYAFGLQHSDALDDFSGGSVGTAELELASTGPWVSPEIYPGATQATGGITPDQTAQLDSSSDQITGSILLHHVRWLAPYLTRPVELPQVAVNLSAGNAVVTSDFSYGGASNLAPSPTNPNPAQTASDATVTPAAPAAAAPNPAIQGSLVLHLPLSCSAASCEPLLQLHFSSLDSFSVQSALLDAPTEKSLFSPIMDRMRSDKEVTWPALKVDAQADSLVLGNVTLRKSTVVLHVKAKEIDVESWQGDLLGGIGSGTGHFALIDGKPSYTIEGKFVRLNPAQLGSVFNTHWTGKSVEGTTKFQFSGLTAKGFVESASGTAEFHWQAGTFTSTTSQAVRFDNWSGTTEVTNGKVQLKENQLHFGRHEDSVSGTLSFGGPAKLSVSQSIVSARESEAKPAH